MQYIRVHQYDTIYFSVFQALEYRVGLLVPKCHVDESKQPLYILSSHQSFNREKLCQIIDGN